MLPSLARRGDHPKLLQHSELVKGTPRLDDFSILNPVYAHPGHGSPFASRRDASQLAGMRAMHRPARHDHVPFGDLLVYGEGKIREGIAVSRDEHSAAFRSG